MNRNEANGMCKMAPDSKKTICVPYFLAIQYIVRAIIAV